MSSFDTKGEVSAAPAPSGWQPIETAPRDGTAILAFARQWWEPANGNARWVDSPIVQTFWDGSQFAMGIYKQPTYWIPMPEKPL